MLYSAPLRDLLLQLAFAEVFEGRWSATIHDEWTRNVLANRPDIGVARLRRTREMMDSEVCDSLVTDFEGIIPKLSLPNPDDRHVFAAAIHGRADAIVTCNLRDFPAQALAPHGIEAVHPDRFVGGLLDGDPAAVLAAVRARLRNPPKSAAEYLATLEARGLPECAGRLRAWTGTIQTCNTQEDGTFFPT